jgi:hypothetical protein
VHSGAQSTGIKQQRHGHQATQSTGIKQRKARASSNAKHAKKRGKLFFFNNLLARRNLPRIFLELL